MLWRGGRFIYANFCGNQPTPQARQQQPDTKISDRDAQKIVELYNEIEKLKHENRELAEMKQQMADDSDAKEQPRTPTRPRSIRSYPRPIDTRTEESDRASRRLLIKIFAIFAMFCVVFLFARVPRRHSIYERLNQAELDLKSSQERLSWCEEELNRDSDVLETLVPERIHKETLKQLEECKSALFQAETTQ